MKALREREKEREVARTHMREESTYALGCLSFPLEELSFPSVICFRETSFIRTLGELLFLH